MAGRKIYQRHAKAFSRPIRLSPRGRKQAGITPLVKDYVVQFSGRNRLERAMQIVKDIASFDVMLLPFQTAKKLCIKRSADDIIKKRLVYVEEKGADAIKARRLPIGGCTDYAKATAASLRAIGLPALIARVGRHFYAKFLYNKRVLIADPMDSELTRVRIMRKQDKINEEKAKKKGMFAEGPSLAQMGIKNYEDALRKKKV